MLYKYSVQIIPELNAAHKRQRAFDLFIQHAELLQPARMAVVIDNESLLITHKKLDDISLHGVTHEVEYCQQGMKA